MAKTPKNIETFLHDADKRKNIPTAEYQPLMRKENLDPITVACERRNRDLDPQLVWRGKDVRDWSDLVVQAPPLYIQEKVHPKALIDDLLRQTSARRSQSAGYQADLFSDFNGMPDGADKTEFYRHDLNWSNRMILGDSLQVMASLAEREGLRGKVQCIYLDPPYGIKFNSNFQWSTTSRDVKDGNTNHITREPEQVKAFRDTWRDGIHSYLTYLRDRMTIARDLLSESGSIFVQIGDENVHRVRALMDEVFGVENCVSEVYVAKTGSQASNFIGNVADIVLWYGKHKESTKFNAIFNEREERDEVDFSPDPIKSAGNPDCEMRPFSFEGKVYTVGPNEHWKTHDQGMIRLLKADRIASLKKSIRYKRYFQDYPVKSITNMWTDLGGAANMVYVVQTSNKLIERCILMTTDPGDLVLDPTCGSGTTAYVAEQWGRRWITIDTSRVALALARARIMGARYPYYLLADSRDGQLKEAEITCAAPSSNPVYDNIRHGFVYERVPHITLKSIANNAEIDVIWEAWQTVLEPLRQEINSQLKRDYQEWEIPREAEDPWDAASRKLFLDIQSERRRGENCNTGFIGECLKAINHNLKRKFTLETLPERPADPWKSPVRRLHAEWWEARIARQKEIDASIAAKAEYEYLYNKPYEDRKKVRVAGPFTVESVSPHRTLGVDENDELIDASKKQDNEFSARQSFPQMILENLRVAGVQQAHKDDRIVFSSLVPWPGDLICGDGRYLEGDVEKRAAIFIGAEFGTVSRADLVAAAREAADSMFDVLITCAFAYEAYTTDFDKLGRIPVLKARMNADLHMADDLKNTGKGNLFVIFGEPDITLIHIGDDMLKIKVNGVDVFKPQTGVVVSDDPDGIACWFIDTDYNEESFFVRHAYFLGQGDPYSSLKTTLKAEIDSDAWETLHSDTSRPFAKPKSGRIAVKVINHLGDEVMKVFSVA